MQEVKKYLKVISFTFLPVMLLISIQGCGKKGPLDPPAGEVSTYPATYPQHAIGPDSEEELGSLDDQGLENWASEPLALESFPS